MPTRRNFVIGGSMLACFGSPAAHAAADRHSKALAAQFFSIERQVGGRLGVAVLDTRSQARFGHRSNERFPLCSTFKLLAAAASLKRVDDGKDKLGRRITYGSGDLVPYSPVTEKHADGSGMTLSELCEAAVTLSDNTAGNLILAHLGGPAEVTSYVRSLGDTVTRLDRNEPAVNTSIPGDPRDTTTPGAMVANLQALLLGNALTEASKSLLTSWLLNNKTGDARLRAGLARGWRAGEKTGTGDYGSTNDVGVFWPPRSAPIVIAAYLTNTTASAKQRNAALASVGRAVAAIITD